MLFLPSGLLPTTCLATTRICSSIKNTYAFVQGGKLPEFNGDVVRLTTALEQSMLKRLAVNASADKPTLENS